MPVVCIVAKVVNPDLQQTFFLCPFQDALPQNRGSACRGTRSGCGTAYDSTTPSAPYRHHSSAGSTAAITGLDRRDQEFLVPSADHKKMIPRGFQYFFHRPHDVLSSSCTVMPSRSYS